MPQRSRQTVVATPAASNTPQACKTPSPANDRRLALTIQNTGLNPGLLQFGAGVKGDGGDILFAAGQMLVYDRPETVPLESINLGSALATTWALIEVNPGGRGGGT